MPPPPPDATLPPEFAQAVTELFLSSTIDDYKPLRQRIRDSLYRTADTFCWMSDEITGASYLPVQEYCRSRLLRAHGYMLLLGHLYGSVPPDEQEGRSITHLEFEWARHRWRDSRKPAMAVMTPHAGSRIDLMLRRRAESSLDKRGADRAAHEKSLSAFRDMVAGKRDRWVYVNHFRSAHELSEQAIRACLDIREGLLIDQLRQSPANGAGAVPADDEATPSAPPFSEAALGGLGRGAQLQAAQRALAAFHTGPHPALALVAYGDPDAEAEAFLAHLAKKLPARYAPQERGGVRPPTKFADLAQLSAWCALSLGLNAAGVKTPEDVAARCHAALQRAALGLHIASLGTYPGRIAGFHGDFWRPFCDELARLGAGRSWPYRLLVVIASTQPDPAPWWPLAHDPARATPAADGARLWPLPPLGPIDALQFEQWLDENGVSGNSLLRADLAERVLQLDGEPDGVPRRVLHRIRREAAHGTFTFEDEDASP